MADSPLASAQAQMADRMADGRLVAIITDLRSAGLSCERIARRLYAEHGIEVTGQTLRRWLRQIDQADGEAAAS